MEFDKAHSASFLLVFYFWWNKTLSQHDKNLRARMKEIWHLGKCRYLPTSANPVICLLPPATRLPLHPYSEYRDTSLTTVRHRGLRNDLLRAAPCLSCGKTEGAGHVTLKWQSWQRQTLDRPGPCPSSLHVKYKQVLQHFRNQLSSHSSPATYTTHCSRT